ncbi:hypothetical protein ASPCAL08367 [Aspergillus calidoustus]|uniref:Metallo-beta-lactamase domain-containing protein n=1 Tax=Aspergillus calidoustus TaxID=454130 RepID=A0A0U5GPZ7_ASPCI|nr:hypothetical protein ASPCAL08367 [Aspergillus calidoustus]
MLLELDTLVIQGIVDNKVDPFTSPSADKTNSVFKTAKGLSLVITASKGPLSHTVLFDTGPDPKAWVHNYTRLRTEIPPVEAIVISHWHPYSSGVLIDVLQTINASVSNPDEGKAARPPLLPVDAPPMQPASAGHHFLSPRTHSIDRAGIAGAGGQLLETNEPHTILDDMFLVTDPLPPAQRRQHARSPSRLFPHADGNTHDQQPQSGRLLLCKLKDKGLVIITGCSHAARLNEMSSHALDLVREAEVKSESETRVHALVGGFHMEEAEQEELKAAVRDLKEINADYILAGNCTGLRFQLEIEENLPNRFVRCFCGGEYIF